MPEVHDDGNAAVAILLTPLGRGAVASIEVRGSRAAHCVDHYFVPASGRAFRTSPIGQICYGRWGGADGEEIVACRVNDSRIELHCHGGRAAATRILANLTSQGAFVVSWREALESNCGGSIRASAALALAESATLRTSTILWDQYAGAFKCALETLLRLLRDHAISAAASLLTATLDRADLGLHLTTPWRVALVGAPNVGKSSLLNGLLGYGRAIVHDQPGTTRDLVTAVTAFDGWPCELVDTAGLRTTDDFVENAGVELAKATLREADLVLWVRDAAAASDHDSNLPGVVPPDALIVWNKCDLLVEPFSRRAAECYVSALTREGVDQLIKAIVQRLVPHIPPPGTAVPFAPIQVERLRRIQSALEQQQFVEAANDVAQWLLAQDHDAMPGEIRGEN